ncbi:MAG TPA: DUF1015 domain-containing protein [Candidatus Limnocylindrales bacterium]|nr:DUF1015 domain-containing protein [Candidatus Limnocylindrales bacterium]
MPDLRPFRALRYDTAAVGPLSAVISPPYDVVTPDQQAVLLARHPRNSVRLDLPQERSGDEPGERYRRAAADLVAWRTDGTLRKDQRPSIYVYEQRFRPLPGEPEQVQRGFFARLKLEDLEPRGGVLPHERTLSGPKEDRYRLLKATGANLSPIIGLYAGSNGSTSALLDTLTADAPAGEAVDDDGVGYRIWATAADGPGLAEPVRELLALAGRGPITLADGHHRYETGLRYRDERRARRACPYDPPYEFTLALLFDTSTADLRVLPTHRLVSGAPSGEALLEAASALFRVERLGSAAGLVDAFAAFGSGAGSSGGSVSDVGGRSAARIGLYTAGLAALLRPDHARIAPLLDPQTSDVLRWLPVSVLAAALQQVTGLDPDALVGAGRLAYTKDAAEAVAAVDAGQADSAFLLDPIPAATVRLVAEGGELMPQKSTYFWPKPATGLLFSPGEW